MIENTRYSKYFKNIVPLFVHHSYRAEVECSDKIIVPKSVYLELTRLSLPFPPLFSLVPERQTGVPVYCAVLEFTAEEDYLYIPQRILALLGYRVLNSPKRKYKQGSGVMLVSLPLVPAFKKYIFDVPRCLKITVKAGISEDQIREGLRNYTMVQSHTEINILCQKKPETIYIVKTYPRNLCLLNSSEYSLEMIEDLPSKGKFIESQGKPGARNFELPSIHVEKIPKHLASLMHSNKTKLKDKKSSHTRSRSSLENRQVSKQLTNNTCQYIKTDPATRTPKFNLKPYNFETGLGFVAPKQKRFIKHTKRSMRTTLNNARAVQKNPQPIQDLGEGLPSKKIAFPGLDRQHMNKFS